MSETTGTELMTLPAATPFSMDQYLSGVANDAALAAQQQLVVAYDRAVRSLVGPNDVQKDGGREFKKKSAWRKLARYFQISTQIIREESHRDEEGHLISTVVVRASAPWGQFAEAIAKCSTRESRFAHDTRKADHDCPATAQTRATNRAVSDLIAAGEVSAEEMEFGEVPVQRAAPTAAAPASRAPTQRAATGGAADKRMPFGKHKGVRLGDLAQRDLESTIAWCAEKDAEKFKDLIAACREVLHGSVPANAERIDYIPTEPTGGFDGDDGLPF